MNKVLFLGTYLSQSSGSKGPGEFVAEKLKEDGFDCRNISRRQNPVSRAFESVVHVLFHRYDFVVLEVYSSRIIYLNYVLSWLIRFKKIPCVSVLHGGAIPDRYPKIKPFLLSIMSNSAITISPSNYIRLFFEEKGKKIQYIPNPFPIENFPFTRYMGPHPRLLWVRAFSSIYNPDLAIRILNEVRKVIPEVTLTMVGPDKGMLAEVQKLIQYLELQNVVTIVGPVPNNQLFEYYHNHSVFLNTTSYESFGLAVLEAAACGIPVVSSPAGEIPFLWQHEKNMFISENLKPEIMAQNVLRLLNEPALGEQLSKNARKKAKEFDWDKIKPQWIKLLRNQISE
ncbi:MAG: glycosyltransferase family 4 protein [Saprospiraceae bacterium]